MTFLLGNKGAHIYNGNIYKCQHCNKTYQSEKALTGHKCCFCHTCSKLFSSVQRLETHDCQNELKCQKCSKVYTSEIRFKRHKCSYCTNCDHLYSSYQKLEKHQCCGKTFNEGHQRQESPSQLSIDTNNHDDDDDIQYVHTMQEKLKFQPLTEQIQNRIANAISVPIVYQHHFVPNNQLGKPLTIKNIRGDGNCFFRSISYLITGSEAHHDRLRKLVIHHMRSLGNNIMSRILDPTKTVEQYLQRTFMEISGTWATEIEIITTSHLLKSDIYVYSKFYQTWTWHKYSGHLLEPSAKFYNAHMYIKNTNMDHYDVVMSTDSFDLNMQIQTSLSKAGKSSNNNIQLQQSGNKQLIDVNLPTNDLLANYFKTQKQLNDLKTNTKEKDKEHQKKYKARIEKNTVRMKKFREKRHAESKQKCKENDRKRKSAQRECLTEEQNRRENRKAKNRMASIRSQRSRDEIVTDHLRDKNRKASSRTQRPIEVVAKERIQAKDAMTSIRSKRSRNEIVRDQIRDKNRKASSRTQRPIEVVAKERIQAKDAMTSIRSKRSRNEIVRDQIRDKNRKASSRTQRPIEVVAKERIQAKDAMTSIRSKRSRDEIVRDQIRDKNRKSSSRTQRPIEIVAKEKELAKERMSSIRSKRSSTEIVNDKIRDKNRNTTKRKHRSAEEITSDNVHAKRRMSEHRETENKITKYRKEAKQGPIYVCSSCHRFMYKSHVVCFKESKYEKTDQNLLESISKDFIIDNKQWICKTCQNYLRKNEMPPQCHANKLDLPPIPPELKSLCDLEIQLLAQRIPFMKITSLPRGAQKGIYGAVVNVPADLQKICTLLPRTTSLSGIISLKLKRKLEYHGHVTHQTIRPKEVEKGLKFLLANNELYKSIKENKEWQDQSELENAELWNSLLLNEELSEETKENVEEGNKLDKADDGADQEDSDEEPDNSNPAVQYDTCLQNPEGNVKDAVYSIAPGEGQKPLSLFKDEDAEVMAFPKLFPTGKFGYNYIRNKSITMRKYFNSRLLNADTRFAETIPYIFFAQYLTEANQIQQNINIALRKKKPSVLDGRHVQVCDLLDKESMEKIISYDEGYHVLRNVRGSPSAWQSMQLDCLAKIRQYGPYTFFLTFSVAEFRWTEIIQVVALQFGTHLTDEEINQMDFTTKSQWLKRNPVTAARHIDYMFRKFFHGVVIGSPHPIGQVLNYDIKKEFQGRGRVHFHIALHVIDAPILGEDSDEKLVAFVDKYISCRLPEIEEDEELLTLVGSLQKHVHSRTCKKKHTTCRFHFPKPPSPKTIIAHPPDVTMDETKVRRAEQILKLVYTALLEWNCAEPLTIHELLNHVGFTIEQYLEALTISTKRHMVILQRQPSEQCINNYNPLFLKVWQANMDIQLILDTYACVMYVTSYLCKAERTMSELLRQASKQCCNKNSTIKERLSVLGNVFLTHRELSSDEAIYRLLSLPLRESSTQVVFLPTDVPEKRIHILKSQRELESLPEESTEVFQINIIDRFMARPKQMENCCYADFGSQYTVNRSETCGGGDDENADREQDHDASSLLSKQITLENNLGTMNKRRTPAVIRFHKNSKEKDTEGHYHRLLMLYYPWRDENSLLYENSYEKKFHIVKNEIEEKIKYYEKNMEQMEDLSPDEQNQHAWDQLAAEVEKDKSEEQENQLIDEENALLQPEENMESPEFTHENSTYKDFTVEFTNELLPENQYTSQVRTLNEKQRLLFNFITDWCWKVRMQHITGSKIDPFFIFLSGGGGVGKSHTLMTAYHGIIHTLLDSGQDPSEVCVVLTAPTGTAAFNIGGMTIHSTLRLQTRQIHSAEDNYLPLSSEIKNSLKCKLQNLKILIIDEISMVGAKNLIAIHRRLQEIKDYKSDTIPFGGVSILAVGDLMQLPPVGDSPVFASSRDPIQRINFTLWERYFHLLELTEVQRQRGDPKFAEILNRIRIGQQTKEDMDLLKSHVTVNNNFPDNCLSIYPTNQQVDTNNISEMEKVEGQVVEIKAKDIIPKSKTSKLSLPSNRHQTGGLHETLAIKVGAQVSIVRNIDTTDGLVNGAIGKITHIEINQKSALKGTIFVNFQNSKVGVKAKQTVQKQHRKYKSVPITAVTARFNIGNSKTLFVERTQYPLTLAWSATIHKVQGQTLDKVIVSFDGGRFTSGQAYVALSRSKSLSGLFLRSFDPQKIKVNKTAMEEMERLNKYRKFTWQPSIIKMKEEHHTVILHLNIRSFNAHKEDLMADTTIKSADVIALTETYLNTNQSDQFLSDEYVFYNRETPHGISAFVKKSLDPQRLTMYENQTESLVISVNISNKKTVIVIIYKPPKLPMEIFKQFLNNQLANLPKQPIVLIGDFNSDILQSKDFFIYLQTKGFKQHIREPTHRFGGILDHIYTNKIEPLEVGSIFCYYSDHTAVFASFE